VLCDNGVGSPIVLLEECAQSCMFTELTLMQIEQAEADDNDEDEEIVEDDVAGGKLSTVYSLGI
jgi:hypothetical protein